MIQLNLLPDVKMEYIKAERQRRLVTSVSILVTIAAIVLLLLLLSVDGLQKKHLSDLNKDIKSYSTKLENEPQITKILTVQNQLESLTQLHDQEPAAARLFTYLNQVTPSNVNITDFKIDFTQNTVSITGTANTLADVNKYVDTLKLTTFTTGTDSTPQPAFSDVVLSSFSLNGSSTGGKSAQPAAYTITASYDKTIFDITQNVTLVVPSGTPNRLGGSPSTDLFEPAPATASGGTQ
ncbi:MAG TPA: PilN domain-containing protein [Candidatus Saccharimonadales bacterium]|nr:PilN domain-containing protein [Candidatus Saccharimonadales bacterium]